MCARPSHAGAGSCSASGTASSALADLYDESSPLHSVRNEFLRVHRLLNVERAKKMVRFCFRGAQPQPAAR